MSTNRGKKDIETSPELLKSMGIGSEQFPKLLSEVVAPAIESAIENVVPSIIDGVFAKIGYSENVNGLVALLAAKSNDSKSEVLRKALTLYGLALDALEKGNKLAIIDSKDMILHDVIGFDSYEHVPERIGI